MDMSTRIYFSVLVNTTVSIIERTNIESTFVGEYFNNSLTGESQKVDEYSTPSMPSSLFPMSNGTSSQNTDIPSKITDETSVIYSSNEPSSTEKNNLFSMDTADSGKRIKK